MYEGILFWLDSIDDTQVKTIISQSGVGRFIGDIQFFNDVDQCVHNLLSVTDEKVFLRLGYGLSYLVGLLNDFDQVQYIYLSEPTEFCGSVKVRGVFIDNAQFFDQLEKDVHSWKNRYVYLTFCDADARRMETTTQDVQNHAARFMWSQMLLETLLRVPSPSINPHKDVLEDARRLYANNQFSLRVIDEFERDYQAQEAIKWYTRDSFLYRLVNKALRTRDIHLIFKFRFLIQHIHKQLKDEQQKTFTDLRLPLTLYRGQLMTRDEFAQIQKNTNQLISVNTFLSTTTHRQTATMFSGADSCEPDLISVVFEILIDSSCDVSRLPPFADVSHLSYMKDENEVLLSMGTVMKVASVTNTDSSDRIIHLRVCDDDDLLVRPMKAYLSKEISKLEPNEASHIHQLGTMLFYMGENEKAEQMLNMASAGENALDDVLRPFFIFVARLAEQILVTDDPRPILRSDLPKFSSIVLDLLDNPLVPAQLRPVIEGGANALMILSQQCDGLHLPSPQSNQVFQRYADLCYTLGSLAFPPTHPAMINMYIVLGGIAAHQSNHLEAINNYRKGFAACEASLDSTHPNYTFILGNMALSYMEINDDIRAEQLIEQFSRHRSTSALASIFALRVSAQLFKKREDWYGVIACQRDILEMSHLPPNSLDTVQAHMNIGIALLRLGDFDAALGTLQTALDLQLQHQPSDHPLTIAIQELIPAVKIGRDSCRRMGLFDN